MTSRNALSRPNSKFSSRACTWPVATPSQQAAQREQTVLLADAMEQLPGDYREVLILHLAADLRGPGVELDLLLFDGRGHHALGAERGGACLGGIAQ